MRSDYHPRMPEKDEAKIYIEEMKKRGIHIYRIADMSPDELMEYMAISKELAKEIVELAREEVGEKMEKKKSKGNKLRMLPHVGAKRSEILHEKGITVEKIAAMKPDELMALVPNLKRKEAEDIIIAAELSMEKTLEKKKFFKSELLNLPYIGVTRAYKLHIRGIDVKKLANMKPDDLLKILPDLERKQAEKIIMAAEIEIEKKVEKEKYRKKIDIRMRRGLVNGNSLVNGKGVVNGLGNRWERKSSSRIRVFPVLLIIAAIILAAILPIVYLTPANSIVIDGNFSDWKYVRGVQDPLGDEDGPLLEVKSTHVGGYLYVYVQSESKLFSTPEGVYIFVDSDDNSSTGYSVGNLGADYMVSLKGWDGKVENGELYRYVSFANDNWSAFTPYMNVKYALKGNQLELSFPLNSSNPGILAYLKDNHEEDSSDIPLFPHENSAFVLVENTESEKNFVEKIDVYTSGKMNINLSFVPFGNFSNITYRIEIYKNSSDRLGQVGNSSLISEVRGHETFYLRLQATGTGTIGFKAKSNEKNVRIVNEVESIRFGNISMGVDGNFDEWKNVEGTDDPEGDVHTNENYTHENIDLTEIKRLGSEFYVRTAAPILAGDCIPEVIMKPVVDSDHDTVPDNKDLYPHDFNNDGIPDNESYVVVNGEKLPDVDGDGIADYPYGPDMWLNTTIPDNFPKPYAGKEVHVYIGPIPEEIITGNDTFFIYISSQNGSYHAPFLPFKSDYMVKISGMGFRANSYLFRYEDGKWQKIRRVKLAFSGTQLEGNSLIGGEIFVLSRDWLGQYDVETWKDKGKVTIMKIGISSGDIRVGGEDAKYENTTLYWNGTMSFGNLSLINCTVIVNGTLDLELSGSFYMDSKSIIDANGTGYEGGIGGNKNNKDGTNGDGNGYGEGGNYNGGGGGGGAYGNYGGDGGGNGGAGGTPYGTPDGEDIDMGSGGGGGAYASGLFGGAGGNGGNGGGCIKIIAGENISIYGEIYANGQNGAYAVGGGGGGGSGGGVLLEATNISIYGYINATGGDGGFGGVGNGGGGGSGGRIKIFYKNSYQLNITHLNVSAGNGGGSLLGKGGAPGEDNKPIISKVPEINVKLGVIPLLIFSALVGRIKRRKKREIVVEKNI